MCVPRLTTVMVAWLLDEVSPLARVEMGTPATIDLRGSGPCFRKWRRSAPLQIISTASFRLAWCLRRVALRAASGRLMDAKARVADTVVLSRVRGARPRLLTALDRPWPVAAATRPVRRERMAAMVSPAVSPAFDAAICDNTPTACGMALTASTTRPNWFDKAPRNNALMPNGRRASRTATAAGAGELGARSRMACPSATAAWPSTAAW